MSSIAQASIQARLLVKKYVPYLARRSLTGSARLAGIWGTGSYIHTGQDCGSRRAIQATYSGLNHGFWLPATPITPGSQRCSSNHASQRVAKA